MGAISSWGMRAPSSRAPLDLRTASANGVAQTSSQINNAAEEFGSSAAATYSMSSGLMRPPTSPSNPVNPASTSSSSISKLTTDPSVSLPMKIRSRTRTVPDSTSAINSGAISPVNLFPGNPTMMYSTGPMVMWSHPRLRVLSGYGSLPLMSSSSSGD